MIETERGRIYAERKGMLFFETSAMVHDAVVAAFETAVRQVLRTRTAAKPIDLLPTQPEQTPKNGQGCKC
jgi:hypothetical protein